MSAPRSSDPWSRRWSRLAARVGISPREPVLVALSGGADSVLLLHLIASAQERPAVTAVHVDHGLRGAESRADADFCAALAAELGLPFALRRAELDPSAPDLEARARRARYAILREEAGRRGLRVIATGHHADDSLETLLMRWLRGSELAGLRGIQARTQLGLGEQALLLVRPLLELRRAEVRELASSAGLAWREDSSNADARFTRNRIRNALLPELAERLGDAGLESLRAFASSVAGLEAELARHTAHVVWGPARCAAAARSNANAHLGGSLERARLVELVPALRRRVLWRLLVEACGVAPARSLLERVLEELASDRTARHQLPGGWSLQLRAEHIHLSPPAPPLALRAPRAGAERQLAFDFAAAERERDLERGLALRLPGQVLLPDGRAISAELAELPRGADVPRSPTAVELDASQLRGELRVRWPRPGDRFHGLGAPGSRALSRFLADAGVPCAERERVPLVFDGPELVWVAGIRPAEARRVRRSTVRRLRLALHGAPGEPRAGDAGPLFG